MTGDGFTTNEIGDPWKPTICVDFDGVLHKYSKKWQDGVLYDPPNEGAQEALVDLKAAGYRVVIFTARDVSYHEKIRNWMQFHEFADWKDIEITNIKIGAIAYVDDRAVRFTNWEDVRKLWV